MRRTRKLLVPALACALAGAATCNARADTVTPVPELAGFQQVLADTQPAAAGGFLFLSGDGSIVVTTLAGKYVTTLDAGGGVRGLALSADGITLYAGLTAGAHADSVAAITVATIATGRQPVQSYYALGTGQVPFSLAPQSGKLWVSYDQARAVGQAGITSINLATATVEPPLASGTWVQAPDLAADPDDSGVLVAVSGSSAATFNTAADPAVPIAAQGDLGRSNSETQCESEQSVAVLPGGGQFIAACQAPATASYYYGISDTSAPLGAYAAPFPEESVAVDGDGAVAIGSGGGGSSQVYVYRPDGTLMNVFTLPYLSSGAPHSLAWSDTAAGARLADVAYDEQHRTYAVHVFDQPTVTDAWLELSAPAWVFPGKSVTLSGTLAFGTGSVPAGTAVTVTRSKSGSTAARSFAVVTGAGGGFRLTDTPPGIATYTYSAAFAGGTARKPARASIAIVERKFIPGLWVVTSTPSVAYRGKFQVTTELSRADGPAFVNRTVSVYAQAYGSKTRKLLKRGPVNSQGRLTLTYTGLKKTMFTAVYGGDAGYGARTVSTIQTVRALVTQKLSGYFARGTYLRFHPTAKVRADATVTPNKHGECVRFQLQEYGAQGWRPWLTTKCATIGAAGHANASVGLAKAGIDSVYRIRADYVAGSSSNASSKSAWGYFTVVN